VLIEGSTAEKGIAFFAGRQRVQRWGDFILHVSLVVVLAGNLLGALFGFEEMLPIVEGKTAEMKHRPFQVTLKDFDIEYYAASGAPSLYASDLLVTQNGETLADQRIIVNQPLDLNRVRFYQASWGMTETFRAATIRIAGQDLTVKPNEIHAVPGTPFSLRANRFYPSFDVDSQDMAYTRDYEGRNPALQVDFLVGGEVRGRVWILKDQPEVAFGLQGPHVFRTAPPPFQLTDVDPVLFSGIQVGYDPGAPVFWFGAVLLLIGLSIHFYLHQRRLRVLIAGADAGCKVLIGGWSSRAPQDFQSEFDRWTDEMRGAVGQILSAPREPA
jgi:cytochrome c biogenesis protein